MKFFNWIVSSLGVICFIYGFLHFKIEWEPNMCEMTYMIQSPIFLRIHFIKNKYFPNYALYRYLEGSPDEVHTKGAPVIFVPGNHGSHKQARSFASMAINAADNGYGKKVDFYTISFDEEYSGTFGGYLINQKHFLKHCINAVLQRYTIPKKVVLLGHSMGGKVAQALLADPEIASKINTIILLAAPVDKPLINADPVMNNFYAQIDKALVETRTSYMPGNSTNSCGVNCTQQLLLTEQKESKPLDNVLMLTISGGNRDYIMRSALTTSKYADFHAATSSIPFAQLSCDHLAIVWCLQITKPVSDFLYGIAKKANDKNHNTVFSDEKSHNLAIAFKFFRSTKHVQGVREINFKTNKHHQRKWFLEHKRQFFFMFPLGSKLYYHHLIPLNEERQFNKLALDTLNMEDDEMLYGCVADNVTKNKTSCNVGISLEGHVQRLQNNIIKRSVALLDLEQLRVQHPDWTHIVLRHEPSPYMFAFSGDRYASETRIFTLRAPSFYYFFQAQTIVDETEPGAVHYRLNFNSIFDTMHTILVRIVPLDCKHGMEDFKIATKLCVPWAIGFERYEAMHEKSAVFAVYVNIPTQPPKGYNMTINPVTLDIFLNPECHYHISTEFSYEATFARIFREGILWLPAHLVAVLFIVLRNQMTKFEKLNSFSSLKPYLGYLQCFSLYLAANIHVFRKLLEVTKLAMLQPDAPGDSLHALLIVHSVAIFISIVAAIIFWVLMTFSTEVVSKIPARFCQVVTAIANILVFQTSHLPFSVGVVLIAIAVSTTGGIALALASFVYFLVISEHYHEYLQALAMKKSMELMKRSLPRRLQQVNAEAVTEEPQVRSLEEPNTVVAEEQLDEIHTVQNSERIEAHNGDELELEATQRETTESTEIIDNEASEAANLQIVEQPTTTTNAIEQLHYETELLLDAIESIDDSNVMQINGEQISVINECMGLKSFPFHITMFLLLLIMTLLNVPASWAWLRAIKFGLHINEPSIAPAVLVVSCFSALVRVKAPNKIKIYPVGTHALYVLAFATMLYCQTSIYRLNYAIAGAFVIVAMQELAVYLIGILQTQS